MCITKPRQAAAPEQRAHVIRPFVSSVSLISTSSLPRFCPFPLPFPSAAGIKGGVWEAWCGQDFKGMVRCFSWAIHGNKQGTGRLPKPAEHGQNTDRNWGKKHSHTDCFFPPSEPVPHQLYMGAGLPEVKENTYRRHRVSF